MAEKPSLSSAGAQKRVTLRRRLQTTTKTDFTMTTANNAMYSTMVSTSRPASVVTSLTSASSTFKPYKTMSSMVSSHYSGATAKSRRASAVIKSMSNKVCEGRMQLYDVKRSKWRPVYTVLTDSEVFIYGMQRETATSRMGYKVGKSKFAIGHLEAGPYPLAGIQLTFLAETSLGKRSSFKVSSSQFALYLSLALEKGKDAKDKEVAMVDRWVRAFQSHMAKAGMPNVTCLPMPCNSSTQEAAGCALCGCLMSADSARNCMWFPKPPLSALALPSPHYLTSAFVCAPCKDANDRARLKKWHMNVAYKRVLESGGDLAHDPELSSYAMKKDVTNLCWRVERPHTIPGYKDDGASEPIRAGRPCPGSQPRLVS